MIKSLLKDTPYNLTEEQQEKFSRYFDLLIEQNKVMNLTAITEPEEVVQKHFLDSLLPLDFDLIPYGASCIDIGTGAGFPGIPLKIVRPDLNMVLLDSLNKRVVFLRRVLQELEIDGTAIHARAEDAARQPGHRERYDVALSRAVSRLSVVAELSLPFVKVDGISLCYKGPGAKEELDASERALSILKATSAVHYAVTPWGERTITVLRKTGRTSSVYPRKAGVPSKNPL